MFTGSIVALITPFLNGQIDVAALRRLVQWQIDEGTQGIVTSGSTGEGALLTPAERHLLIETAVEVAQGRIPIIAACSSPATWESLELAKDAKAVGCAGVLVMTPYYVKPTLEGVYQHFKALNEVGIPIIVYNHPGRANINLSPEFIARLSELPNIVGVKDSCEDTTRVIKMRRLIKKPFSFLSGDDPVATAFVAHGGDGVISVSANAIPSQCRQVMQAWKDQDLETFAQLRDKLLPFHEGTGLETNPTPIKYAVAARGLCSDEMRLPLLPAQESTRKAIDQLLKDLGAGPVIKEKAA